MRFDDKHVCYNVIIVQNSCNSKEDPGNSVTADGLGAESS